jgi:hypothetical protein
MTDFRVLVTGSREWPAALWLRTDLSRLLWHAHRTGRRLRLVHGAHWAGVDWFVKDWVEEMRHLRGDDLVMQEPHPAKWKESHKGAGPNRNRHMVSLGADLCLAYPFNASTGTRGCAQMAVDAGIPTLVTEYGPGVAQTLEWRLRGAGIMILEEQ